MKFRKIIQELILYQGAINPFRGIDKAILAMHHLENVVFKIAGDGPRKKEYEDLVLKENLQNKVQFFRQTASGRFKRNHLDSGCRNEY